MVAVPKNAGTPNRWVLIAGLVGVFLLFRTFSSEDDAQPAPTAFSSGAADAIATEDPSQPASVDEAAVRRAAVHASRAVGALGAEGATQYSELCYEALRREYSAKRRDRCYAFDLFAARLLERSGEVVPYQFTEAVIRSRWTDDGDEMVGANLLSDDLRTSLEALATSIAITPESPPTSAVIETSEVEDEAEPADEETYPEADEIDNATEDGEAGYGTAVPA